MSFFTLDHLMSTSPDAWMTLFSYSAFYLIQKSESLWSNSASVCNLWNCMLMSQCHSSFTFKTQLYGPTLSQAPVLPPASPSSLWTSASARATIRLTIL
jgi:hypothetical protein